MSYLVLARKYRPRTFDEVVGQGHVMRTLKNAIQSGRIAHAFLFVGPRGIGKTSTARILAKALNCPGGPKVDFDPDDPMCKEIEEGRSLDVIEIDGASNNGVEQVRDLRESVQYTPAKGTYKIYIIDEVHMLSTAAFNALLKTLEEPPPHVKFIFATTEAHKVLATILSRCQRFDLKRITTEDIEKHLKKIAALEGVEIDDHALHILARNAEGGMRDAESALDQLISFCGNKISEKDVQEIFGLTGIREVWGVAEAIQAGMPHEAVRRVRDLVKIGKDLVQLTRELVRYFRNMLVFIHTPEVAREDMSSAEVQHFDAMRPLPSAEMALAYVEEMVRLEEKIRHALVKEVIFEIAIMRMAQQKERVTLEEILKKVTRATGVDVPLDAAPIHDVRPAPAPEPAPTPVRTEPAKIVSAREQSPSDHDIESKTISTPAPEPAAPPAPVQVAKPEPELKPAPTPARAEPAPEVAPKASAARKDPKQVWDEVIRGFKSQRELLAEAANHLKFLREEEGEYIIEVELDSRTFANIETPRNKEVLEELLAKHAGGGCSMKFLFKEEPLPEAQIEMPPAPAEEKSSQKKTSKTSAKKAGQESGTWGNLDPEEFKNDPLIRQALQDFGAKLVGVKQKKGP